MTKDLKYEFDNIEEWKEANNHLKDYHDCERCHGKIVGIQIDQLSKTHCGSCGEIVKYPRLTKEAFKRFVTDAWGEDLKEQGK